uniref:Uncharacterized protein n=1 Tax=Cacopsylla melanoneura TaxID=428564 RepID=A0A8D8VF27_9HEMI
MANHRFCEALQNILNLGPRYTQAKIYVIPDPYFLRFEDKGISTEITLGKLQQRECGTFIIKSIWKENLDKVLGFDVSPENTELLFYTKSQIHVYSFFNELVEEVKQIDIRRLFQDPDHTSVNVLPIHCTLQIAQCIVSTNKNQVFYVIIDINKEVLQICVELHKAQCCTWHMEIVYVLTTDGLLCKYNTFSGVLISEEFNIYSVIPRLDQQLELKHLSSTKHFFSIHTGHDHSRCKRFELFLS